MERNYYYCPFCHTATAQIEVSLKEIAAHENNDLGVFATAIDEFLGTRVNRRYAEIRGNRYWKCGKCLRIYRRDIRGEIIAQVHTSVEGYYNPTSSERGVETSNSINFNTFQVVVFQPQDKLDSSLTPQLPQRSWIVSEIKVPLSKWDGGGFVSKAPEYAVTLFREDAKNSLSELEKTVRIIEYAIPNKQSVDTRSIKKSLREDGCVKVSNLSESEAKVIEDKLKEFGFQFILDYKIEGY